MVVDLADKNGLSEWCIRVSDQHRFQLKDGAVLNLADVLRRAAEEAGEPAPRNRLKGPWPDASLRIHPVQSLIERFFWKGCRGLRSTHGCQGPMVGLNRGALSFPCEVIDRCLILHIAPARISVDYPSSLFATDALRWRLAPRPKGAVPDRAFGFRPIGARARRSPSGDAAHVTFQAHPP